MISEIQHKLRVFISSECVDDVCIISCLEREDNEKKNCRGFACIGLSGHCIHTMKNRLWF